jgi:hypothetical protein
MSSTSGGNTSRVKKVIYTELTEDEITYIQTVKRATMLSTANTVSSTQIDDARAKDEKLFVV